MQQRPGSAALHGIARIERAAGSCRKRMPDGVRNEQFLARARLSQDLSFYRGIVANGEAAPGIKIERFDLAPIEDGKRFRLRFALMQTAQPEGTVTGTLQISLQGTSSGRPATLPMQSIAPDKRAVTSFSFRFFEDVEQLLSLPPGFVPADIVVEARVNRAGAMPLRQIFPWDAH